MSDGERRDHPTIEFVDFRAEARRLELGFEVHAGEMGPPSSIAESLDILEADRPPSMSRCCSLRWSTPGRGVRGPA
ncbi:MAG TPA: hypothetical protein VFH90_05075 [Candidatus Limnocylindria bacterium]|nr:hypothetical protein [Candidatus Limnocylindria bacterium]